MENAQNKIPFSFSIRLFFNFKIIHNKKAPISVKVKIDKIIKKFISLDGKRYYRRRIGEHCRMPIQTDLRIVYEL